MDVAENSAGDHLVWVVQHTYISIVQGVGAASIILVGHPQAVPPSLLGTQCRPSYSCIWPSNKSGAGVAGAFSGPPRDSGVRGARWACCCRSIASPHAPPPSLGPLSTAPPGPSPLPASNSPLSFLNHVRIPPCQLHCLCLGGTASPNQPPTTNKPPLCCLLSQQSTSPSTYTNNRRYTKPTADTAFFPSPPLSNAPALNNKVQACAPPSHLPQSTQTSTASAQVASLFHLYPSTALVQALQACPNPLPTMLNMNCAPEAPPGK